MSGVWWALPRIGAPEPFLFDKLGSTMAVTFVATCVIAACALFLRLPAVPRGITLMLGGLWVVLLTGFLIGLQAGYLRGTPRASSVIEFIGVILVPLGVAWCLASRARQGSA
jgi:hypothetical protein